MVAFLAGSGLEAAFRGDEEDHQVLAPLRLASFACSLR